MYSFTEENYLKAIYKLLEAGDKRVSTNAIAAKVEATAASVTDMLRKLADKKLIRYEKYQGVALTAGGRKIAVNIIRKHRLWELFLVERLGFKWDEVHDIAEELEHIKSADLVNKLDDFLGNPKFDPHGDPIPDKNGDFGSQRKIQLSEAAKNSTVVITGVIDHQPSFLQYLDKNRLSIGRKINVKHIADYDKSMDIVVDRVKKHISHEVARNILVTISPLKSATGRARLSEGAKRI
jgi:DtxR family Mn-dependent transcriptional regulator